MAGRRAFQKVRASSRLEGALGLDVTFERRKYYDVGSGDPARIANIASIPLRSRSLKSISLTSGRYSRCARMASRSPRTKEQTHKISNFEEAAEDVHLT
jgi:hypothetical protein